VDNIVVWVPDQKVLFGGCLIKSAGARTMGYIGEADLDAWPATLATVEARFGDAAWIVPGHGSPGGVETLRHTAALIGQHRRSTTPPVAARPFFTALSVRDIDTSTAWYGKVFGYAVTRAIDLPERGLRIRLLRNETAFLELVEDGSSVAARERIPEVERIAQLRGVFKSGAQVDDLDATVARLEHLGVPLRGKIVTESDSTLRSAQIEDPDGNIWQLFQILDKEP
jgi:catechol 2,3-dioxygenase-like lactoylglutathione lyase family enzyme